ncbi:hypothetical protein BGZ67_000043 [Mortierella alpina]|nr:hypothetical protein BGZ67_000043 [Mortierella alpina]
MPRATFPLHRPPPRPHHWSASLFLAQLFSLPVQRSPQHQIRSFSLLRSSVALPSDDPFSSPTSPQSGESFTPSAPSAPSAPSSSPRLRIHSASSKRNSSYWSPEDDSLLLDLRHKGQPWHQIGQALGRSRQACNRRFNAVLDPDNGKPFWARHPEMNVILETLVAKRLGWNKIADYIGINASSCEKQWRELKQQQRLEQHQQQQSCMQADTTAEGPQRRPSKQRPFRRADVELLKAAVAEHGNYRWDSIAEIVFQSRYTVHHLRYQYTKLERRRQVWTLQQEGTLLQVVAGLVPKDRLITPEKVAIPDSQWDAVADTIQGEHTGEECRRRWLKLQLTGSKGTGKGGDGPTQSANSSARLPTSTRVVWTAEQSLLLESIIQDMKNTKSPEDQIAWKVVSDRMGPGFSKAQCKSRWNRMIEQSALSKTGRWNSQELEHLFSGLLAVGPAWTEIHRDWLPGRSPKFIHGKWKQILSRVSQDQVIQRLSWQDACVKSFGSAVGGILDQAAKRWPNITTDRSKSTE